MELNSLVQDVTDVTPSTNIFRIFHGALIHVREMLRTCRRITEPVIVMYKMLDSGVREWIRMIALVTYLQQSQPKWPFCSDKQLLH